MNVKNAHAVMMKAFLVGQNEQIELTVTEPHYHHEWLWNYLINKLGMLKPSMNPITVLFKDVKGIYAVWLDLAFFPLFYLGYIDHGLYIENRSLCSLYRKLVWGLTTISLMGEGGVSSMEV